MFCLPKKKKNFFLIKLLQNITRPTAIFNYQTQYILCIESIYALYIVYNMYVHMFNV